jgi:hypothetical protein
MAKKSKKKIVEEEKVGDEGQKEQVSSSPVKVRRFKKRPDIKWLNLEGRTITEDMILEGEEWAKYCPEYLVEILEESAVKPLEFTKR